MLLRLVDELGTQRVLTAPVMEDRTSLIHGSVREIREALTRALGELEAGSTAAREIDALRHRVNRYLTTVENLFDATDGWARIRESLVGLRAAFATVLQELGEAYDLEPARDLGRAVPDALEWRSLDALARRADPH